MEIVTRFHRKKCKKYFMITFPGLSCRAPGARYNAAFARPVISVAVIDQERAMPAIFFVTTSIVAAAGARRSGRGKNRYLDRSVWAEDRVVGTVRASLPFSPTAHGALCHLAVFRRLLPTRLHERVLTLCRGLGTCHPTERTALIHFPLFPPAPCTSQSPSLHQRYRPPVGEFV